MKRIKYLLLIIGITFISISNVNAEEINPCYNDYIYDLVWNTYSTKYNVSKNRWDIFSYSNSHAVEGLQILFPLNDSTIFYIKTFNDVDLVSDPPYLYNVIFYDSEKTYFNVYDNLPLKVENNQYVFDLEKFLPENTAYFSLNFHTATFNTFGSQFAIADFDLSSCPPGTEPEEPDIPEVPEEPEKPEIIPDTTLNNFYNIYTSKLKQISQYSQENKFILGAIGIVLSIVIINLFLYLFNKGGNH